MFKLTRKSFYILLFSILWLITAFSSFFHAVEFFELSNVTWMGIILAMAFEIGQASVLMSILTSSKDRKRYTPWILMCILTLVQIIGNVYSSYKYIMLNSPENLRYFKEPIFIWTQLPDAEATVIITYVSAAILPIVALLMTSMITNYLSDQEDNKQEILDMSPEGEGRSDIQEINDLNTLVDNKDKEIEELKNKLKDFENNPILNEHSILQMENQGLEESNKKKDEEIEQLKQQLKEIDKDSKKENEQEVLEGEYDPDLSDKAKVEDLAEINDIDEKSKDEETKKDSHFINL